MRVLISGAGIAGPTLAYWLKRYGFEPTIVEKSAVLRRGGYVIDFWGAGFDIADRMGLIPEITGKGYTMREVRVVNRAGQRVAGFSAETFSRVAQGRYTSLPRDDLASSIFGKIENHLETIFDDSITRIEQLQDSVEVSFQNGPMREFDLVVGADGLHSKVRELVFGAENQFEKYLGYKVAAFEALGYRPKDELTYVMYTEVEQQMARFTMRDDRTMFLFIFKDESPGEANDDVAAQKALLRRRFGASGWECPQILNALDANCDLYFDRVSQIRMNPRRGSWGRGRVVLVGDAAFCVSLLAGQGSALAMVGAYILAGELYRAKGEYSVAFDRYQQLFHPFVWKKQQAALRFAGYFAPKSKFSLFLRNSVMNLMRIPWLADFVVGREISDRIPLPEYD